MGSPIPYRGMMMVVMVMIVMVVVMVKWITHTLHEDNDWGVPEKVFKKKSVDDL